MLRFLFSFDGQVDRKTYALAGFGLILLKYLVDAGVLYASQGIFWAPTDYLSPLLGTRMGKLNGLPSWLELGIVCWSVPFLWIGTSMTLRRAIDAGVSPWSALLFFVPVVNYAWMLLLCVRPTGRSDGLTNLRAAEAQRLERDRSVLRSALLAVAVAQVAALFFVSVGTYLLHSYGLALLAGVPFLIGVLTAYFYNRLEERSPGETFLVLCTSMLIAGGSLALFAIEGLLCILMAAPLGLGIGLPGMFVGRALARVSRTPAQPLLLPVLILPLLMRAEVEFVEPPLYAVTTDLVIDAPPEVVWRNVVEFSELPPPDELFFRLGIAHPLRARIEGSGVGAVRYCEFSTGPFVEPITAWEEPSRLAFDVVAQPAPMRELSPYGIQPPHLDHFIASRRGEFRLTRLEGGRTHLEGTTWYALKIYPAAYFRLWSDHFIHDIHHRVLAHIKALSEAPAHRSGGGAPPR